MMFRYESLISNPFLSEHADERSDYKDKSSISGFLEKSQSLEGLSYAPLAQSQPKKFEIGKSIQESERLSEFSVQEGNF